VSKLEQLINNGMIGIFKWFKRKIEVALVDEFLVEIWFAPAPKIQEDGSTVVMRSKKEFTLGSVIEISQNHIKGKTTSGGRFELRTLENFDYNVTQTK
jgi:hypothetical protein